jgi:hypothetical protein
MESGVARPCARYCAQRRNRNRIAGHPLIPHPSLRQNTSGCVEHARRDLGRTAVVDYHGVGGAHDKPCRSAAEFARACGREEEKHSCNRSSHDPSECRERDGYRPDPILESWPRPSNAPELSCGVQLLLLNQTASGRRQLQLHVRRRSTILPMRPRAPARVQIRSRAP